jgi:peptide/nickel transport system substrate-binding protein
MLQLAVRRAISLAINRTALVDRSMEGLATTANEPLPAGMFGYDDKLPAVPYDPEGARKLLAEAGYPKGFRLVLHCSNGRYVNDRQTCLTVAQMLTRVGIVTEVQAEPQSTFYARMTRHDFSLILNGWGSESGDSILVLRQTLHATNRSNGTGGFNRGDYANPEVDALIDAASATIDPTHREDLQKQAVARTMQDVALVPLYTADWIWGTRKGLTYQGSAEEGTLAIRVQPVQ